MNSVSISLGEGPKDDFIIDVEGLPKDELRLLVIDAVYEALRKNKKVKDFTVCN
jgi:hypothetical protein